MQYVVESVTSHEMQMDKQRGQIHILLCRYEEWGKCCDKTEQCCWWSPKRISRGCSVVLSCEKGQAIANAFFVVIPRHNGWTPITHPVSQVLAWRRRNVIPKHFDQRFRKGIQIHVELSLCNHRHN